MCARETTLAISKFYKIEFYFILILIHVWARTNLSALGKEKEFRDKLKRLNKIYNINLTQDSLLCKSKIPSTV